jgi:pyridoxine 4-oxidase
VEIRSCLLQRAWTRFDVLIIGAGSAGCVLAARLSDNPKIRVGLVEAGGQATAWADATGSSRWSYEGLLPAFRRIESFSGPALDDPPIIDPKYLTTDHDRRLVRQALDLARMIGHQPALAEWRAEEIHPGIHCRSDADLDAFLQRAVMTHHHPVGTCRMGRANGSVVDADLKLHGFEGLHVVDASVIPAITSGPIHAAVLAIADTFATDIARPSLA